MVQKDYVLRIVEQLASFLSAILFNKKIQNYDIALEKIEEAYNGLLFLGGDNVKILSVEEIIQNNTYGNILNKDNIEIIANLLFEEADIFEEINGGNQISLDYYIKSFLLFNVVEGKKEQGRHNEKINEILAKLNCYEIENEVLFMIYRYLEMAGLYGKAEDKLYELSKSNYPEIKEEKKLFYNRLLEKTDKELDEGNLPRNEIMEELKNIKKTEGITP